MKAIAASGVLILGLASCGSSATRTPQTQVRVTSCEQALSSLYAKLGGAQYGQGRFEAAVNALAFNGTLPRSCDSLSKGQVMSAAKEVSR